MGTRTRITKMAKPSHPKTGEQWMVGVADDIYLKKMLVVNAMRNCVELQEVIEGVARGPKIVVTYKDSSFVEKVNVSDPGF